MLAKMFESKSQVRKRFQQAVFSAPDLVSFKDLALEQSRSKRHSVFNEIVSCRCVGPFWSPKVLKASAQVGSSRISREQLLELITDHIDSNIVQVRPLAFRITLIEELKNSVNRVPFSVAARIIVKHVGFLKVRCCRLCFALCIWPILRIVNCGLRCDFMAGIGSGQTIVGDSQLSDIAFTEISVLVSAGTLLRQVDDFLLLTTCKSTTQAFVKRISKGFPEYNCFVNPAKTRLNFSLDGDTSTPFNVCLSLVGF